MQKGKVYEKFVNKFIKGIIVSDFQDYYDISTKTTLYEVKGVRIYHQRSFGRYKINLENHNNLLELSQLHNKQAKYLFVLKIDSQMIWKSFSWKAIDIALKNGKIHKKDGKEIVNLSVKEIW